MGHDMTMQRESVVEDYDDKPYGISPAPGVCCPDAHQGFGDRCTGCGADCMKCVHFMRTEDDRDDESERTLR